jgi:hypothetical protein
MILRSTGSLQQEPLLEISKIVHDERTGNIFACLFYFYVSKHIEIQGASRTHCRQREEPETYFYYFFGSQEPIKSG